MIVSQHEEIGSAICRQSTEQTAASCRHDIPAPTAVHHMAEELSTASPPPPIHGSTDSRHDVQPHAAGPGPMGSRLLAKGAAETLSSRLLPRFYPGAFPAADIIPSRPDSPCLTVTIWSTPPPSREARGLGGIQPAGEWPMFAFPARGVVWAQHATACLQVDWRGGMRRRACKQLFAKGMQPLVVTVSSELRDATRLHVAASSNYHYDSYPIWSYTFFAKSRLPTKTDTPGQFGYERHTPPAPEGSTSSRSSGASIHPTSSSRAPAPASWTSAAHPA